MWNDDIIERHLRVAQILEEIKNQAFELIKNSENISEFEVHNFILESFAKNALITDENRCIVAFRENTSFVHYYPRPSCREIKNNSLIMIDLWARLKTTDSPYADITWMAYKGEMVPAEIQDIFDLVTTARDEAIRFIEKSLKRGELPIGKEVDEVARDIIHQANHGEKFSHTLGHSIGMSSPHGEPPGLTSRNEGRLKKMQLYTIEPGVYLENKFGVRSELDFYIDNEMRFVLTTGKQDAMILL